MSGLRIGAVIVAAASLLACESASQREPAAPMARRLPIVNGTLDTDPMHDSVAVLFMGGGMCTGTLIAPRVILTAAHCLEGVAPTQVRVGFGRYANQATLYRVIETRVHPEYDSNTLVADIALARLAEDVPFTPIPHLRAKDALTIADENRTTLIFSGYGETETGSVGTRLTVTDTVGRVCTNKSGCAYIGGYTAPQTLCYDQSPGGPCSGDSGGPAFVAKNGRHYVAGVTSYGDQNCAYFGCSTKVDAYDSFILDFLGGGLELGARCESESQCLSGHCADGVCCDRACDAGVCDACSIAAGAPANGTCSFTAAACDDGDACTGADTCSAGACVGAPLAEGTPCIDGDGCTLDDACHGGICRGAPRECPAPDACHLGSQCNRQTGVCDPFALQPDGTACDDGDACTTGESCAAGACTAGAEVSCAPAGACQEAGTCDAATGVCAYAPLPDGTTCGEGECKAGVCEPDSCGCSASSGQPGALLLGLLAWGAVRRRRAA